MNRATKITRISLTLALINLTGTPTGVPAQPVPGELFNTTSIAQNKRKRVRFVSPPVGQPTRRTSAGSRGNCPNTEKRITALVTEEPIGLTASERPTLWFYIPYPSTPALSVEFVLRDERKKDIYQTTLPVPGKGIVSVPLPETVSPLESGKTYQWVFAVICDPADRMKDDLVKGKVTREALKPEVQSQLEAATSERDRVIIYAENGLWYEAVTLLAELRRRSPEDKTFAEDWADLLGDVGLADMATEPFVP
jgi:hypothetical protein